MLVKGGRTDHRCGSRAAVRIAIKVLNRCEIRDSKTRRAEPDSAADTLARDHRREGSRASAELESRTRRRGK